MSTMNNVINTKYFNDPCDLIVYNLVTRNLSTPQSIYGQTETSVIKPFNKLYLDTKYIQNKFL